MSNYNVKSEIEGYVYEVLCSMNLKDKKEIENLARSLQEKLQKELIIAVDNATKEYLEDTENC